MEQLSQQLKNLKQFLFNQFRTGFFNAKVLNAKDISDPIVDAIHSKKQEVLDPEEIYDPITEKIQEFMDMMAGHEMPKEMMVSNLTELATVFKEELSKIETKVTVDQKAPKVDIKIENKELVKSFEKLISKLTQEQIDYTPIMSEMCDLIEQSKPVIDLNNVEILLAEIFSKNIYIPIEDDRVKVSLSDEQLKKIGKGFGTYYPTDHHLRKADGDIINPATEGKQDDIITAIQGNLVVQGRHLTSTNNSTTTPLGIDGVFTGTGEIIAAYQATHISVITDVDSAINGLEIQYSQDNTNWDNIETHTIEGGKPEQIVSPHNGLYFRLKLTNGSTEQSYLRIQVMHHGMPIGNKLERIDGDIQDNHMVQSTRALLTGKGANGSYYNVETNRENSIKTSIVERDIFENIVTTNRDNQVKINFFEDTPQNLLTVTTNDTGTATSSLGLALFATGTGTTSFSKGVTTQSTRYLGFEVYSMFTAAFTNPTNAGSYQRIGLYDSANGFFVGYEGTSFGITHRNNTSDATIAQASFNEDLLDGSASSKFTSDGSPIALDKTKMNIYRVRFAWLGAGPIFFDVLSPDSNWVTFHKIRYPNTSSTASLTTPNLPMTVDVSKTSSDATDLIIKTGCWAAGSTSSLENISETITDDTLASKVRAILVAKNPSGTYGNINRTTGGNLKVSIEEQDAGAGLATEETLQAVAGVFAKKITSPDTNITYIAIAPIGSAQSSAVWQAKKILVSGNDTVITWAGGGAFNQVATNLTALSYV